jgi:lipopolysaccharide export system protein LptA
MTLLPSLKPSFRAASLALITAAISFGVVSGIAAEPTQRPNQAASDPAALVTIESDVQQADNQTGIVTATGNVRITYPGRGMVATSRQAQYFSREGRLVLTGDVDVVDADGQRIRAERLTYNLDQERLLAQPSDGKQVTSKLRMKSATSPRVGPPMP